MTDWTLTRRDGRDTDPREGEALVEELARVLCSTADENWNASNFNETMDGAEPDDMREYWRNEARAVIALLRAKPIFFHTTPNLDACDHDFQGWRDFPDGNGGEQVCTKCGIGAMTWSLRGGP